MTKSYIINLIIKNWHEIKFVILKFNNENLEENVLLLYIKNRKEIYLELNITDNKIKLIDKLI